MKRLVVVPVLAISVGLGVGCTDKAAQTALAELRAQAAVEQQNEALVRNVFDKLDNRDDTVFQELYAPEYGWHTPANSPNALTREQEAEFVKLLWAGFPDMRWDIAEVITRGDRVVVRFTVKGTQVIAKQLLGYSYARTDSLFSFPTYGSMARAETHVRHKSNFRHLPQAVAKAICSRPFQAALHEFLGKNQRPGLRPAPCG